MIKLLISGSQLVPHTKSTLPILPNYLANLTIPFCGKSRNVYSYHTTSIFPNNGEAAQKHSGKFFHYKQHLEFSRGCFLICVEENNELFFINWVREFLMGFTDVALLPQASVSMTFIKKLW